MKWKLLLVSGLGAAGLGFSEHSGTFRAELVLCCIPFVCAYVDLVCNHLSLRIRVIGKFISSTAIEDNTIACIKEYEKFIDAKIRGSGNHGIGEYHKWFDFRNWPGDYICFLDVRSLPKFNLLYPAARDHIIEAARIQFQHMPVIIYYGTEAGMTHKRSVMEKRPMPI